MLANTDHNTKGDCVRTIARLEYDTQPIVEDVMLNVVEAGRTVFSPIDIAGDRQKHQCDS